MPTARSAMSIISCTSPRPSERTLPTSRATSSPRACLRVRSPAPGRRARRPERPRAPPAPAGADPAALPAAQLAEGLLVGAQLVAELAHDLAALGSGPGLPFAEGVDGDLGDAAVAAPGGGGAG